MSKPAISRNTTIERQVRARRHGGFAVWSFVVLLLASTGPVFGQTIKYTQGNTDGALRSNLEVDPSTLGLSIQIPLNEYAQRGGSLPITLRHSSKLWRIRFKDTFKTGVNPVKARVEGKWGEGTMSGWTASWDIPKVDALPDNPRGPYDGSGGNYGQPYCDAPGCYQNPPLPPLWYINRKFLTMPDGSTHELRKDDVLSSNFNVDPGTYYAVDGSNIRYDTTTATLYLPDGSRYLLSINGGTQAQYIDRNGNTMTYTFSTSQWTDTLGRGIGFLVSNGSTCDPNAIPGCTKTLPGTGVSNLNYKLWWRQLGDPNVCSTGPSSLRVTAEHGDIPTNMPPLNTAPYLFTHFLNDYVVSPNVAFNPIVLYQIILPNGQAYTFNYNIYGEIDKITYPTGGYEKFTYGIIPGLTSSFDTQAYNQGNRGVTKRQVSVKGDGTDLVEWNYSATQGSKYTTKVIAPNNSYSERDLQVGKGGGGNTLFGFDDARAGRAYDERTYTAGGQLLRRTLTKWEVTGPVPAAPTGEPTATRNARVTKVIQILLDTGGNALAKTTTMAYDADLNVTETKHYDYASITQTLATSNPANTQPATINAFIDSSFPLGTQINTEKALFFLSDSAYSASWTTYRNRNLLALPTKTWVETLGGTITARTEYIYDEAAYAPLTNTPAAGQWSDPGTTARGTATTVQRWLNISTDLATGTTTTYAWPNGQWLVTHTQTDVCGSVRKMWDARGKVSEITYSNTYAYAYPTQTLTPPPYTGGNGGLGIPFATNQQLTTSVAYDFATGKVTSTIDANGQTTTNSYANDALQRLTKVTRPTGGGETSYEYNDTPGTCACDVSVKTRTLQSAGVYVEDYVFFDGLGRTWRTAHGEGSGNWSVKDTQYDNLGRVWKTANPMPTGVLGGAPTRGNFALVTTNVTTAAYDELSRVLTVTTPDTSVVTTTYSGNQVTVADQANGVPNPINSNLPRNTTRRSVTDGLGRLTQVIEAPGSLNYTTDYSYDTLSNLRQVTQGAQNRYFLYDSAGRLVRARNPEQDVNASYNLTDPVTGAGNNQWVLKYAYDENGNLKKRWDARGVATSYSYDDINRNYSIGYATSGTSSAGTAAVERYYDGATLGKGKLWRTISYNAHPLTAQAAYQYNELTAYDTMGRPTNGGQWFLNSSAQWVIYPMSRSYDLASHVTGQTYPSNRTVSYSYTSAGRLNSFTGTLGDGVSRTYADTFSYNAAGQATSERFGTQTQLYHTMQYNLRHQMWDNRLGTTAGNWNRGALFTYYSVTARNIGAPGGDYSGNNGNVWMQEHYVPTNDAITTHTIFRDVYEYDDLNRIKRDTGWQKDTANNWTSPHQQGFNYDQWGNRTIDLATTFGSNINNIVFGVNTANNRLNGLSYDFAGNVTTDTITGSGVREYDGENRMTKAAGVAGLSYYAYDAGGKRVRRITSGVESWYVYGFDSELIAEYPVNGAASTPQKEYGYRDGQMLVVAGCDVARWVVSDHLGTPRIEVDVAGSLANVRRHDYLPFGEELTVNVGNGSLRSTTNGYAADCVRQRFTDYERDDETGLDFAQARYYSNRQGRFTSPDSFGGRRANPQTLNLYSYVLNNPLKWADPTGHFAQDPKKEEDYDPSKAPVAARIVTNEKAGFWGKVWGGLKKIGSAISSGAKDVGNGIADIPFRFRDQVNGYIEQPRRFFDDANITFGAMGFGTLGTVGKIAAGAEESVVIVEEALAESGVVIGEGLITNPIPSTLARVVPGEINPTTLAAPWVEDAFVTAAADIQGMNAAQIAERLAIPLPPSGTFRVIEFPTSSIMNLASPVFRSNPGFVGRGLTAGGAREFVIPNSPIPAKAISRIVGQ